MRILHTADWHFDKKLEGRDRLPEQAKFVDELCDICQQEKVDLVLMAGDVYQSGNPSAAAEELFYYAIERLSDNGKRGIVVIAGNHDSPERLCAASPLAARHGITLVGRPKDPLAASAVMVRDRAHRVQADSSWLELHIPGCEHHTVIAALPYPSEARLKELLSQSTEDIDLRREYNGQIELIFEQLAQHYRPDTVNLAMSHLYVNGGIMSDSEHQIQLGGAYSVDPQSFPNTAQYIALGHLHGPQTVGGAPVLTRYSGSPIAYSFSECNHKKSVVLVDVVPGQQPEVREIPITSGRPLVKWVAQDGMQEVLHRLEGGAYPDAWIDLSIHVSSPLAVEDIHILRNMHQGLVTIRPILPELESAMSAEELRGLPVSELFARFYEREKGVRPDDELVELFLELTQKADEDDELDGEEIAG